MTATAVPPCWLCSAPYRYDLVVERWVPACPCDQDMAATSSLEELRELQLGRLRLVPGGDAA